MNRSLGGRAYDALMSWRRLLMALLLLALPACESDDRPPQFRSIDRARSVAAAAEFRLCMVAKGIPVQDVAFEIDIAGELISYDFDVSGGVDEATVDAAAESCLAPIFGE